MKLFARAALAAALLLSCLAPAIALAQPGPTSNNRGIAAYDNLRDAQRHECIDPATPPYTPIACGGSGGTASFTPWTKDAGAAVTLSVTTSTATPTALPGTGATIWLINNGPNTAYCLQGAQAATTDNPIAPGNSIQLARGSTTTISCITASGTASVVVLTGSGNPSPAAAPDFSQASAVGGQAARGASVSGNPLYEGCRGTTAAPTAVTDGQMVDAICGEDGKRVGLPYAIKELQVRGTASGTDGSAHSIIASAGGSLKNYITDLECYNTSAVTITVTMSDAASSVFIVPAGLGFMKTFNVPLATAAATAFSFTASTGETTVGCSAQGFKGL